MKKSEIRIDRTYWTWSKRSNSYRTYPIKIVRYDSEINQYEAELPSEEDFTELSWFKDHEIYSTEEEALSAMCDIMACTFRWYHKEIARLEEEMNKLHSDLEKETKKLANIREGELECQN